MLRHVVSAADVRDLVPQRSRPTTIARQRIEALQAVECLPRAQARAERDRLRRPDRARRRAAPHAARGARAAPRALPLRLPRRVPGHRRRPARARQARRRRRRARLRRRRRGPGHLRLARGVDPQHVRVPATTSRAPRSRRCRSTSAPGKRDPRPRERRDRRVASARARSSASRSSRPKTAPRGDDRGLRLSRTSSTRPTRSRARIAEGGEPWSQYAVLARNAR